MYRDARSTKHKIYQGSYIMQNINILCMNAMLGKEEWAERIMKTLFTAFALDGGKRLAAFPPLGRAPVSSPRDRMGHAGPPKIQAIGNIPMEVQNQISPI
jgi:hypothetical protein